MTLIREAVATRPISIYGHLNRAAICLFRADHLHIGWLQSEYLERAAEHLRAAGHPELAERVDGDLRRVTDAVRELLEGENVNG